MRTYATDAAGPTGELRALVGEVSVALANYRQNALVAGAGFAPHNELAWHDGWTDVDGAGGSALDALLDLCDDFDHLDGFVGLVADAVFEAEELDDDDPDADQVYSLTAGDIAEAGVGFASRDESIAEAERLVEEFDGFDASTMVEELDAWGDAVAVIQNDTAGSVALVEGMGADGLEQLPDIGLADGDVPDATVGVVRSSLETALDTLPRDEPWQHTDPANADLPLDQRLDLGVHVDLLDNPDALLPYTNPTTPNINRTLGRADARVVEGVVGELDVGELHNQGLSNEELIDAYHGLQPVMDRPAHLRNDGHYTASMLNELGSGNTDTMVELTNSFGLVHPAMEESASEVYDGYVVPLASIVSTAEQSGNLDQNVYDAVFHPEDLGSIPDRLNGTEADSRRARALLLFEGGFSPEATAALAEIAVTGSGTRAGRHREGFTTPEFFDSRPDLEPLADNAWAAHVALMEGDPEAAFLFYSGDHGNISDVTCGWPVDTHLTGPVEIAAERLGWTEDDTRNALQWGAANSLYAGLHDYPILADAHSDPAVIDTVTAAMRYTGRDGAFDTIDLPDPIRIRMAEISTPYSADLAIAGERSSDELLATRLSEYSRLEDLTPDEVDEFFEAVAANETATVILSRNGAALTGAMTHIGVEEGLEPTTMRVAGVYNMQVGQALNANHYTEVEQAQIAYAGRRVWTDMTVDLITNGITSQPHIRGPAATPPGRVLVSHFQGEARDAVADLVLGELELPDGEEVNRWYHTTRDRMDVEIGRALFENDEERARLIELEADNDHDVAGADTDFDTFMTLRQVGSRIDDLRGRAEQEFRPQVDPSEQ